jgi:catechol 2,3-dioxygenase-like lactoylglutathione lyase family enzyme
MIAITHVGLAVPDLEKAVDWYEKTLRFELIAGPYFFDASEEKKPNMIQDLQGQHIKRMKNAHLTAGNGVGLELFEFMEPRMERREPEGYHTRFFHLCLIVDDVDAAAERIEEGGSGSAKSGTPAPESRTFYSTARTPLATPLSCTAIVWN